ncbi:unnamed protein product [Moneuplotes crassus]|uniref:Uncharacterized protein n=1 Tax=Euplotes crassus TaxID=5936 RepID=A0AAD1USM6_EUPCR|nr:unnamed protein product [Moneuplotes crassus]
MILQFNSVMSVLFVEKDDIQGKPFDNLQSLNSAVAEIKNQPLKGESSLKKNHDFEIFRFGKKSQIEDYPNFGLQEHSIRNKRVRNKRMRSDSYCAATHNSSPQVDKGSHMNYNFLAAKYAKLSHSDKKTYKRDYFNIKESSFMKSPFRNSRKDRNICPEIRQARMDRQKKTFQREKLRLGRFIAQSSSTTASEYGTNIQKFNSIKYYERAQQKEISPKEVDMKEETKSDQDLQLEVREQPGKNTSEQCKVRQKQTLEEKKPFREREHKDVLKVQKMNFGNNSCDVMEQDMKSYDKENMELKVERRKPTLYDFYQPQPSDLERDVSEDLKSTKHSLPLQRSTKSSKPYLHQSMLSKGSKLLR